ncbi:hypothetical protein LguiB_020870 [Lonicera macranthoides]
MSLDNLTAKTKLSSPWKRKRDPRFPGTGFFEVTVDDFDEPFDLYLNANIDLDIDTKKAVLKVSAAVVSLVSQTGGKPLFMGSGTIIDSADVNGIYVSTILTSASILRSSPELDAIPNDIKVDVYLSDGRLFEGKFSFHDYHYNIATIKIESDAPLPTAVIRHLDDSLSIDQSELCSFGIRPHSNKFKLYPEVMVVGVGRYYKETRDIMAAPGKFSIDFCKFDCKELFRASCKITKCGIGGPLINHDGEVIGVNFFDRLYTPFLPINIASKCVQHFEKYGTYCRPWLGIHATNLYTARLEKLENTIHKFPNIYKGVIVEEVIMGSPAYSAGILPDDVIVECGGKSVQGFLEFFGMVFDKASCKKKKKQKVDLVVLRGKTGARVSLTVAVEEATTYKVNRWPLPEPGKRRCPTLR